MAALAAIGEGLVELTWDGDEELLRPAAGGDAANVVVMASRLGAEARLGGRVGGDPLGSWLLSFWARQGVDVAHVCSDPHAPTGLYLNAPAPAAGHEFTYWRRGSAGSRLSPGDVGNGFFAGLGFLVVTGVTLAVSDSSAAAAAEAARRARAAGARIACILNHRPALGGDVEDLAEFAGGADLVIGSREDAMAVFGEADPLLLADAGLRVPELVLTAAGDPVVALADGVSIEQPVPEMPVADAAGAGDAFAGAYLARRLAGESPSEALAWGVAASARSVVRRGCAGSYPTLAEVGAFVDRLPASA